MEHLSIPDRLDDEALDFRECPNCRMATTFIRLSTMERKENLDFEELEYYRCLKCLHLYTLELQEVKD